MVDSKVQRHGRAEGLADKGRPRYSDRFHEADEKAREHAAVIGRQRFVGLAKSDVVDSNDAESRRQSPDLRHPAGTLPTRSMQQDDRLSAAGFEGMHLVAEHASVLRGWLNALLRVGGGSDQQGRSDQNGKSRHEVILLLFRRKPSSQNLAPSRQAG